MHLPETLSVGKGFVCCPRGISSQIDILISDRNKPTLFKDGELVLLTPDAVCAVIEVKTSLDGGALDDVITKLSDDVKMIREEGNERCQAGLFVYEKRMRNDIQKRVLSSLQLAAECDKRRAINWVSFGPNLFFRFWENGADVNNSCAGPVWHSYDLRTLGHAYFVSNVVWDVSRADSLTMQFAWFPIEGGKERYRKWFIPMSEPTPREFDS
jgi:hypothetical protein